MPKHHNSCTFAKFCVYFKVSNTPSPKKDFSGRDPDNSSESDWQTSSQTEQTKEMKRLRILEQELSQKLRQSNARRQMGKETRDPRDQKAGKSGSPRKTTLADGDRRPSSDSELILKKNSNLREMIPPVDLAGSSGENEVDGVITSQSAWDVFKDVSKLNKVKQIQVRVEKCIDNCWKFRLGFPSVETLDQR